MNWDLAPLITYVCQEVGERKPVIPSESKHLARCSGDVADRAAETHQNDQAGHHRRACLASGRVVEDIDVGVGVSGCDRIRQVADTVSECDDHDETGGTVQDQRPHHSHWQYAGCITDLFSCGLLVWSTSAVLLRLKLTHVHGAVRSK